MIKAKNVLNMYDALKQGKEIRLESFCNEYKISVPTFRRYMSFVREYLWEKYLEEVIYDKDRKIYFIKR